MTARQRHRNRTRALQEARKEISAWAAMEYARAKHPAPVRARNITYADVKAARAFVSRAWSVGFGDEVDPWGTNAVLITVAYDGAVAPASVTP